MEVYSNLYFIKNKWWNPIIQQPFVQSER
jgi:hypothetical protein